MNESKKVTIRRKREKEYFLYLRSDRHRHIQLQVSQKVFRDALSTYERYGYEVRLEDKSGWSFPKPHKWVNVYDDGVLWQTVGYTVLV